MIYLITNQDIPESNCYKIISVEESLRLLYSLNIVGLDTETLGLNPHIGTLLTLQLGNKDFQVVIDCTTVSPKLYKDCLESKLLVGQNLKFDLQWLYNYSIIPRKIYDTMIVEQLLYLGWPKGSISYSLQAIAERRLNIYLDKSVRGQIIWRGLDESVIKYGAKDVEHLEDIMWSQIEDCRKKDCLVGAKLECDFVPSIAYLEWCGIKLDEDKWKAKMDKDKQNFIRAEKALNDFVINNPSLSKYTYVEKQGDLFLGFDLTPKCTINWSSSQQVIKVAKDLGFNTQVQDKKTGEDKDSVIEKHLSSQKGINDEFLKLYFDYQEYTKVISSFGESFLNAINPITGRLHTVFRQLSTSSGRLSCGSQQPNEDLAKLKGISPKDCKSPNIQQLPSNHETRSSFVAPEGYNFVAADYSAEESRLAADIYQDKEFLKEFLERSGDTHSMFCWAIFKEECKALGCKGVEDIKEKAPKWRKATKNVEFAYLFGAAAPTIAQAAKCSVEQAQKYIDDLDKEFIGLSTFAKKGSKFVRENGYILICPITGHKKYWWDHKQWIERQKSFTPEFWEEYRQYHKGTGDEVALQVRQHFQAASKYDRDARNVVTQGTGAIIMKEAMTQLFNWIVDNNYFSIIHICASVHDEICCDYPKEVENFPNILKQIMEEAAAKYCKSLPIPSEPAIGDYWIH